MSNNQIRSKKMEEFFMRRSLDVARAALMVGEVPVGCVIVWNKPINNCEQDTFEDADDQFDYMNSPSVIVSHGSNQVNATRDATRHAECVAIDRLLSNGIMSDRNRLPHDVFAKAYPSSEYDPDHWVNIPESPSHWKNKYGWGTDTLLQKHFFSECDLYVTVEPCIMCAAALAKIGIGRVLFGCRNSRFGGNGSLLNLHNTDAIPSNSHSGYEIVSGILEEDAINMLRCFYNRENMHAPEEKRKRKLPRDHDT